MKIKNEMDFVQADKRLNLKELSADEIYILDVYDIWDGPLSGKSSYKNEECFFFSFDQLQKEVSEESWPRKYILFKTDCKFDALLSTSEGIQIGSKQLIGWFDSLKGFDKSSSQFLKSYFQWRDGSNNASE
jgi:hypothetical protein